MHSGISLNPLIEETTFNTLTMKNEIKKGLDSFISKQVKDVTEVKGGLRCPGEFCYIIINGNKVYC